MAVVMEMNNLSFAPATLLTTQIPVSRVRAKADGQLHGWRSSKSVRVERYRRPDAPVVGSWIRVKPNAASRCDHWRRSHGRVGAVTWSRTGCLLTGSETTQTLRLCVSSVMLRGSGMETESKACTTSGMSP